MLDSIRLIDDTSDTSEPIDIWSLNCKQLIDFYLILFEEKQLKGVCSGSDAESLRLKSIWKANTGSERRQNVLQSLDFVLSLSMWLWALSYCIHGSRTLFSRLNTLLFLAITTDKEVLSPELELHFC